MLHSHNSFWRVKVFETSLYCPVVCTCLLELIHLFGGAWWSYWAKADMPSVWQRLDLPLQKPSRTVLVLILMQRQCVLMWRADVGVGT